MAQSPRGPSAFNGFAGEKMNQYGARWAAAALSWIRLYAGNSRSHPRKGANGQGHVAPCPREAAAPA